VQEAKNNLEKLWSDKTAGKQQVKRGRAYKIREGFVTADIGEL